MTSGPAEFQGALVALSKKFEPVVGRLTGALARFDQPEALAYVTDAYPEVVTPYIAAAGDLSATWYEDQPVKRGMKAFFAKPAELPTVDQLAANGRWALVQQDPAGALVGSSRRQIFNQSRETIEANAREEGVRWLRHARAGACGFCRMLATRVLTEHRAAAPGLYQSEGSASRNTHSENVHGHDHCRCIAVPLRGGAEYVAPDYLSQWLDDYDAVAYEMGPDGVERLLPPQKIADRMEALGRERGDLGDVIKGRGRPKPKPDVEADVVDLDSPREQVAKVQRLTERNADRAEQIAAPIADRVAQAKAVVDRADDVVSTAANVTAKVKRVTDTADKLLGGKIPVIRDVKAIVDAADKTLQSAGNVTAGAAQVAAVADQALSDTVAVAHGARQIADEIGDVLDEAGAIALGARALVAQAGKATRGAVDGESSFADRVALAVEQATQIQTDGAALVARARGTVEQAQGVRELIAELPDVARKPIADVQELAQTIRDLAVDVDEAGADAAATARAVRRLVDAVADWRRARDASVEAIEAPRAPVRVQSERIPPAEGSQSGPRALPPAPERLAIEAPSRQVAAERPPDPQLAIEAGRQPRMLTAAPERPAVTPPKPGAVTAWLDAEDEHRAAVEYWRRVDEEDLHSIPPAQAILENPPAETPVSAGEPLDIPGDPDPVVDVRAVKRAGESALDRAVRDFEDAIATGDEEAIARAADAMEALEQAEAKAVERRAKAAERRQAAANAEQDRIFAAVEAGTDPVEAEADELIARPSYQRKIREQVKAGVDEEGAKRAVYNQVVERIRRRDFMAGARAEGHTGKGFDDLVDSVFSQRVESLYVEAENATRGKMLKTRYELKFSPKRLWLVNDATARKYMSDEMAEWFDQNGRFTKPVFRQMILDGETNVGKYQAMNPDYLQ